MAGPKQKRRVILRLNINDQLLFSQDYGLIQEPCIDLNVSTDNYGMKGATNSLSKHIVVVDQPIDLRELSASTPNAPTDNTRPLLPLATKVYDLGASMRCWHCTLDMS